MKVFAKLSALFPKLPPKKGEAESRLAVERSKLVSSFSRGNISLQQGRYITQEEINTRKAELLSI